MKTTLIAAASAVLLLAGCSSDSAPEDEETTPVADTDTGDDSNEIVDGSSLSLGDTAHVERLDASGEVVLAYSYTVDSVDIVDTDDNGDSPDNGDQFAVATVSIEVTEGELSFNSGLDMVSAALTLETDSGATIDRSHHPVGDPVDGEVTNSISGDIAFEVDSSVDSGDVVLSVMGPDDEEQARWGF